MLSKDGNLRTPHHRQGRKMRMIFRNRHAAVRLDAGHRWTGAVTTDRCALCEFLSCISVHVLCCLHAQLASDRMQTVVMGIYCLAQRTVTVVCAVLLRHSREFASPCMLPLPGNRTRQSLLGPLPLMMALELASNASTVMPCAPGLPHRDHGALSRIADLLAAVLAAPLAAQLAMLCAVDVTSRVALALTLVKVSPGALGHRWMNDPAVVHPSERVGSSVAPACCR